MGIQGRGKERERERAREKVIPILDLPKVYHLYDPFNNNKLRCLQLYAFYVPLINYNANIIVFVIVYIRLYH